MRGIPQLYRDAFRERRFFLSVFVSLVFLAVSLWINYEAGVYATESASNVVTDIILSNIRVYDVDWIFVYGSIVFWTWIIILLIRDPRLIPFTLKTISLFIVIRAFFISLTHIGPIAVPGGVDTNFILRKLTFGGDLFFSGHTGLPFLLALVFWRNARLRYAFLTASGIFATSVILGHYHYSIDVFAAYFITYSIFCIAEKLFAADRAVFDRSPSAARGA